MTTSTCEQCVLYEAGESTETADGIRIQRLLLKVLSGGPNAEPEMLAETDECEGCTKRLAARLTYANAEALVRILGSVENVKQSLKLGLMVDLNELPPDPLAPPNPLA